MYFHHFHKFFVNVRYVPVRGHYLEENPQKKSFVAIQYMTVTS